MFRQGSKLKVYDVVTLRPIYTDSSYLNRVSHVQSAQQVLSIILSWI